MKKSNADSLLVHEKQPKKHTREISHEVHELMEMLVDLALKEIASDDRNKFKKMGK